MLSNLRLRIALQLMKRGGRAVSIRQFFSAAKTSDYNPEGIEIEFYKKIDDFFKERSD